MISKKTLMFKNSSRENKKITHDNNLENIIASTATIGSITSDNVNVTKNISANSGSMGNNIFYHDKNTDTGYIQNLSKKLVVKGKKSTDEPIKISENGDIMVKNLDVTNNMVMMEGTCNGDFEAHNINLIGDLVATDIYLTHKLKVDGNIHGKNAKFHNILTNNLIATNGIIVDKIITKKRIISNVLESHTLTSPGDINIIAGFGNTVNVPNISYGINADNLLTLDPIVIKSNKIFIVSNNISLLGDNTCDGIEIIVYNQNIVRPIIVRDPVSIIDKLPSQCAIKLVYIFLLNRWVKL